MHGFYSQCEKTLFVSVTLRMKLDEILCSLSFFGLNTDV